MRQRPRRPLSGATTAAEPAPEPAPEPRTRRRARAAAAPASAAEQLAAIRREAIAAAREAQQHERELAAIRHEIDLLADDADAGRRGLAESRTEQERLLGAILHRARGPARDGGAADASLLERLRGEALMREADPELRAQLRALTGEIARLDALQKRIAAKKAEEAAARQALAEARERVAAAVARRNALLREMLPPQGIDAALRIADIEGDATGIGDLIKRTEAAEESGDARRAASSANGAEPADRATSRRRARRPRTRPVRANCARCRGSWVSSRPRRRDPGGRDRGAATGAEPAGAPPHPPLVPPVAGTIVDPGGEPGAPEAPNEGLSLNAVPGATVVAPFDGKIIYAGPFRDLGRVLIIRHDRRYYSVLAGLGRVDAKLGDWVLAGEPVGAMPDFSSPGSGAEAQDAESEPGRLLYYELRHDGRPVDPQPWLASVEDGHDERNGEQKVSQ